MMKTLCVAAVVLSLTSVCQPASLACEKLLKPVDKGPDVSGSWYIIAVATESCWATTLLNSVFWPSIEVIITSMSTPNLYSSKFKFKMYGYCENETEEFLYENNNLYEVDSNNAPTGNPDVLLQSGCPDCMAVKREDKDVISSFLLFSRRENVTAAELKEFESQAECLGWSKPQVLNSDHDDENCPPLDDVDMENMRIYSMIFQRMKNTYSVQLNCLSETFFYYRNMAYEWVKQQMGTI
ncbi:uncharacterized protein LOC141771177 isoform X1 [Sebastes fasciatus]|uniref:uncharacterized protein LOC141771177 isoform X1 n=1 Tax=Sebastes fasciatus TaxID=394691 RepID=UPI003D9E4E34